MSKYFFQLGVILVLLVSCNKKETISHRQDYDVYLSDGKVAKEIVGVNTEINFWQNRLQKDTGSYVDMLELASNHLRLFRLTGNIIALKTGDSLLKRSSAKLNDTDPEILYSLSQNSIAQHQFLDAARYTNAAREAKGDLYTIRLLQFDVNMELGKYNEAYASLQSLKDKSAFDYLVRKAKWEDHTGNLDKAILLMEDAFEKVKEGKKSLYCWTLSNLADMYGHAGRIEDAYESYLAVLKKDSANLYCLKGIAWIAYSHDNNTADAKRILKSILTQTEMPELKLFLAEIAESEGDEMEKNKLLHEFITAVTSTGYGNMYNKYLIELYASELKQHNNAHLLAQKELKNRFTPETCDWIAWVYYNKGDIKKAFEYASTHVYKRTFEPQATMHTAFIYAAIGKKEEAKEMFKECLTSSFELGPVATREIELKLQSL